ncbi:substrate-binding domain-containing protein [Cognatishimia sp. 1_MG-2023]|uniref:ABC transporter substrate-binding protein n=1 Tax=Cognatishimia sp. 1_MG-2023 TaxID=3062642 RepID=UPI0026E244DF|nr:substrate-binding domain-containing protein [Cognatishimia sp. 1_MG-2023]MDO6728276.1 substrate-binding domain-containing protein [Cognatishimia sp. 1_MG-2023]
MSSKITNKTFNRRTFLKTSAGTGLALSSGMLAAPALAQSRSLKVGAYGGYFENSLKKHVYPKFTEATGIAVESVTQPDSTSWLQTMTQALKAGNIPTDLSMHTPTNVLKGERLGEMFAPVDPKRMPNVGNLDEYFLHEAKEGILAVGSLSFFSSMVVNPDEVTVPTSWAEFWDTERFEASLGLPKTVNFNFLDIVAATFFDGAETLRSRDGIVAAIEKTGEILPNVALWYSAESQMEQALKNFDVVGGMYFHDVAGLMKADGHPIESVFPKEGCPISYNSWTLSNGSTKSDEAHEFINFTSDPAVQAIMARTIGTAPVVDRSATDLTEAEFMSVSGSPAIRPPHEVYVDEETFIAETWNRMIAKA